MPDNIKKREKQGRSDGEGKTHNKKKKEQERGGSIQWNNYSFSFIQWKC